MVALASVVGLAVYLYPFALPTIHQTASGNTRAGEAPIVLCGLILLCLAAILREIDPMRHGEGAARIVALLASMVAIGAVARLIPSFLGASPIFLLVILGGYVFGPAFGFQLGALTLAVSAFLTGGIGPWVPYQMLGVGWVGMFAGLLPRPARRDRQLAILAGYGVISGLIFGALLNLWFWPFAAPGGGDVSPGLSWSPDLSLAEALGRYLAVLRRHLALVRHLPLDRQHGPDPRPGPPDPGHARALPPPLHLAPVAPGTPDRGEPPDVARSPR